VTRRAPNGRFSGFAGSGTDLRGDTWGRPAAPKDPAVAHTGPAPKRVRVGDVMTRDVRSCRPTDTLASAALTMSRGDCRFLPVVDQGGRPVGVITDGDICLLGATDYRPLRDVFVSEAMSRPVQTCRSDQDIREALALMRSGRIRHVPVVGDEGLLVGLVSLTDLVLAVEDSPAHHDPLCFELASTLREISQMGATRCRVPDRRFVED
jgi:CBS domain-containing protein